MLTARIELRHYSWIWEAGSRNIEIPNSVAPESGGSSLCSQDTGPYPEPIEFTEHPQPISQDPF
jgi:hypothetical protein